MAFWSRPAAVGLDIGTRQVKVSQLKKTGKKIELEKFGIAEIYPSGEKPPAAEAQRKATIAAITRALADAQIVTKEVVTAVAGESIIVRYIELPEMSEQELSNALRWEAEEYIPFQIDDVNIDSAIIGHSGEGAGGMMDVLLVCARKELIQDHIALLKAAGLTVSIIDVDSFAFLNSYDHNYDTSPGEAVGLINIGGDLTTISVYADGMPRFSRDISIGGSTISTAIHQRLKITLPEAEALKIKRGVCDSSVGQETETDLMNTIRDTVASMTGEIEAQDSNEIQADRVIRNTLGNLTGEIRRSLQFYENQSRGQPVRRILIGGGSANSIGLTSYLQEELGLNVEIVDPLSRIAPVAETIDLAQLDAARNLLSVSIGLALRKVVE